MIFPSTQCIHVSVTTKCIIKHEKRIAHEQKQSHQRYSVSYKVSRSMQQKIVTAVDHLLTTLFTKNKPSGHEKFLNEIYCLISDTCVLQNADM